MVYFVSQLHKASRPMNWTELELWTRVFQWERSQWSTRHELHFSSVQFGSCAVSEVTLTFDISISSTIVRQANHYGRGNHAVIGVNFCALSFFTDLQWFRSLDRVCVCLWVRTTTLERNCLSPGYLACWFAHKYGSYWPFLGHIWMSMP